MMIPKRRKAARRGMAALELALMAPVLCFICMATVDYARLFYARSTIADCARNGALYGSDSSFASSTSFTSIQQAALADASNLSPAPTVQSATDATGTSWVQVTVTYTFSSLVTYPGIPATTTLTRTSRMAITPP